MRASSSSIIDARLIIVFDSKFQYSFNLLILHNLLSNRRNRKFFHRVIKLFNNSFELFDNSIIQLCTLIITSVSSSHIFLLHNMMMHFAKVTQLTD